MPFGTIMIYTCSAFTHENVLIHTCHSWLIGFFRETFPPFVIYQRVQVLKYEIHIKMNGQSIPCTTLARWCVVMLLPPFDYFARLPTTHSMVGLATICNNDDQIAHPSSLDAQTCDGNTYDISYIACTQPSNC